MRDSDNPAMEMAVEGEHEIDLLELLHTLLDNLKWLVIFAVLGAALLASYSLFVAVPMYESTASLYVVSSKDSVVDLSAIQVGSYLTSDYQEVLKTWEVHDRVKDNLALEYTFEELEGMMTINNPSNTRIISIGIKSDDPMEAAVIANEYAEVARDYIAETMITDKPNILSVALPAEAPYSPNITRNTIIGFLLGALAAVVVVTVMFVLNDKIRSADDIEKYVGMPTLATVPMLGESSIVDINEEALRQPQDNMFGGLSNDDDIGNNASS